MKAVANIIDIKENVIVGKLYKDKEDLIAKPNVKVDSKLPFVYYYKRKLYDKIEIAIELGVVDELEINDKLVSDIQDVFNRKYEVVSMSS